MYTRDIHIYLQCWVFLLSFSLSLPVQLNFHALSPSLILSFDHSQFEHKNYSRFWCWWFKTSFFPINFKPHFRHFFYRYEHIGSLHFFLSFFLSLPYLRALAHSPTQCFTALFFFTWIHCVIFQTQFFSLLLLLHEFWSSFVEIHSGSSEKMTFYPL